MHRRGKKGSVQQKREGHAVGRAGRYSTEPSKGDKYKFSRKTNFTEVLLFTVKGDTFCVLWDIFSWAFDFCHAVPPVSMTYIHFTYSASCSMIQFFIIHQHPLDQCSGARLLVITTMTQTPLPLKPQKHNPVTSCEVPTELAEQPLATTLLHKLSRVITPQAQPSRFTVAGTQYFLTLTCSLLTVLIWTKMPVETDIYMNTIARKSESSWGWFFKTEGGN